MHQELTGELEQLGGDLDDIQATISMVEGNRSRFHLSDAELQSRKRFVTDSRRTLEDLQKDVNGPQTRAKLENDKKAMLSSAASSARTSDLVCKFHETMVTSFAIWRTLRCVEMCWFLRCVNLKTKDMKDTKSSEHN
eukprot:symbB.v1.2.028945.t1/scaffold3119.1/size63149/8